MPSAAQRARSAGGGVGQVAAVELVVAGDEHHRHAASRESARARPSGCRCRRRARAARRRARLPARSARSRDAGRESSCSRISARAAREAPWHCLNLRAAAARAGVVAADLGRVAAHRVDLVAQRRGDVVELGDSATSVPDRGVERWPAIPAPTREGPPSATASSGRKRSSRRARSRRRASPSASSPGSSCSAWPKPATQGSSASRTGIDVGADAVALGSASARARISGSKPPNSAIERLSAAWRRRISSRARRCSGARLGLAPAVAAGVEHEGQPFVGVDEPGLDDDAAQEAVEHHHVERLERLRHARRAARRARELGVAQVGRRPRPRRRDGGAGSRTGLDERRQACRRRRAARALRGNSAGRRWASLLEQLRRAARARPSRPPRRRW